LGSRKFLVHPKGVKFIMLGIPIFCGRRQAVFPTFEVGEKPLNRRFYGQEDYN
jgi:hypothetical protein